MLPLTLNPQRMKNTTLPLGTSWLLGSCMEARGKQDLWARRKPEALEALRERALIQSVESSNRIEGVTVDAGRLRPVIIGKVRPRDRSEEELGGYHRALHWIFTRKGPVIISGDVIRRLHGLAQGGSGDAGEWKTRDNEIIEILPNGDRRIRFVPATARQTPALIDKLCRNYNDALHDQQVPTLLLAGAFVFDFLCIHPFRDGNGRVSRLLTTLLLQSQGFDVARYISLERLIEQSKEDYYRILGDCSQDWPSGENEILPWWNYLLGTMRTAYQDLERQLGAAARPAKGDLARRTILEQAGEFTLADLAAQLPSASPQLIKLALAKCKSEGLVRLTGKGRGARWLLLHPTYR